MKKLLLLLLALLTTLALPSLLSAQTINGERVRLSTGPCIISSDAGPPIRLVFTGTCSGLTTAAATDFTLKPTGDLITDPTGKDILPGLPYDINVGMLSKKYLTLHAAELWVETLVAQNTLATIGGRVLVAPTNILTQNLATSDVYAAVKYNNFSSGDRVYMEANGSLEFMAVTTAATTLTSAYPYHALADGTIGYWRLGEPSGTTAADLSGNSHPGTYTGTPTLGAAGALADGDTAVTFNGSSQYVDMGDVASFHLTGNISLEAWFKTTTADGNPHVIVGKSAFLTTGSGYALFMQSATAPRFYGNTSGGSSVFDVQASGTYNDGAWHYVVATWDGTTTANRVLIYVDAVLRGQATATGATLGAPALPFRVGMPSDTVSAPYGFNGTLDEPAIYNVVLTPAEVTARYALRTATAITSFSAYGVTRNLDGSGSNQWYAGDALLDTGTTGNGFLDIYSTAGVLGTGSGPTIVGNVRTGTTYNAYAPRWAIGNLNGLYGYGSTTYGAVFGDPSATNITIDATNGIRIRNGTTNKLTANTSGDLSLVGDLSVGTAGAFRINATGYSTGTGIWMDYNAGTPRFRVGNPAGNQVTWDGTTLAVTGVITANSGTIGSFTIGTYLNTGSKATYNDGVAGVHLGSDGIGLGSAFTVSAAGALVASSATITGSITATSGAIGGCSIGSTTVVCGGATLDTTGLLIATGSGSSNSVRWSDGSVVFGNSGALVASASNEVQMIAASGTAFWTSAGFYSSAGRDLGTSGNRWTQIYLANTINWSNPPTTTSDDYPMVYSTGNTQIYRKTNAYNGTCSNPTSIVIERGIITGCS